MDVPVILRCSRWLLYFCLGLFGARLGQDAPAIREVGFRQPPSDWSGCSRFVGDSEEVRPQPLGSQEIVVLRMGLETVSTMTGAHAAAGKAFESASGPLHPPGVCRQWSCSAALPRSCPDILGGLRVPSPPWGAARAVASLHYLGISARIRLALDLGSHRFAEDLALLRLRAVRLFVELEIGTMARDGPFEGAAVALLVPFPGKRPSGSAPRIFRVDGLYICAFWALEPASRGCNSSLFDRSEPWRPAICGQVENLGHAAPLHSGVVCGAGRGDYSTGCQGFGERFGGVLRRAASAAGRLLNIVLTSVGLNFAPLHACRVGGASHPGPASGRCKTAAALRIDFGKEHYGESFDKAFGDSDFVAKVLKRKPAANASDGFRALHAYFTARQAKRDLAHMGLGAAGADPPAPASSAGSEMVVWSNPSLHSDEPRPAVAVPRRSRSRAPIRPGYWPQLWSPLGLLTFAPLRRRWCQGLLLFWIVVLLFPNVAGVAVGVLVERGITNVGIFSQLLVRLLRAPASAYFTLGAIPFARSRSGLLTRLPTCSAFDMWRHPGVPRRLCLRRRPLRM